MYLFGVFFGRWCRRGGCIGKERHFKVDFASLLPGRFHKRNPVIELASSQSFADVQLSFSNQFVLPRLLTPASYLKRPILLGELLRDEEAQFMVPKGILAAFYVDWRFIRFGGERHDSVDILLVETFVAEVAGFQNNDDEGSVDIGRRGWHVEIGRASCRERVSQLV